MSNMPVTGSYAKADVLVSCIMPTNGRLEWMLQAIRYFQRQDYEHRELIVVDAGGKTLAASVPSDPRIKHLHVPFARSIGAMRNLGCERAGGEIIMHWDDDDWYSANRISAQVRPIVAGEADITALNDTCFFDINAWRFWRCTPQFHQRLFVRNVHGGTLTFRRSLFDGACRYPEISLAEDAFFLQCAISRGAKLMAMSGDGLFVYVRHGANAWAFPLGQYLDPAGWSASQEPESMADDRAFYLARSQAPPAPVPSTLTQDTASGRIAIGVHVHAEPHRLLATLAALRANTAPGIELLLLGDGPDAAARTALAALPNIAQASTDVPLGAPACFNRLVRNSTAETLVLLESGTIVGPGWLRRLCNAIAADPRHGLACPSTNRAWNQLAVFPEASADDASIVRTAAVAAQRFGSSFRSLAPLWDVGDFCLAVRRAVVDAVGPADETYGLGPCWEMDYAIRAVRAGFLGIWAQGAYVFRHPFTERRQREEGRLMDSSRRRYQDKFCGMRLSGARKDYAAHCRGEACSDFAPATHVPVNPSIAHAPAIIKREPFVSCIMPTNGRRPFLPGAIKQFLDQDYQRKELVVIDDGEDAIGDLIVADASIRYFHETPRRMVGSKRNSACEKARGDILVHWDDDDWYAPWRLAYQVEELERSGAVLCGLDRVLFIDETACRAWEYAYPPGGTPWVYGATLCYRRDLWQCNRFPDLNVGEDTHFVFAAAGRPVRILQRREFFVGRIHAGNVSPKQTRDPRFRPTSYEEVYALIAGA
jgi:glycosyltransferase involved in cell wall biosynthesis/GT2 family glycosyltransferase